MEAPDDGNDLRDQVGGRAQGSGEGELRRVRAGCVLRDHRRHRYGMQMSDVGHKGNGHEPRALVGDVVPAGLGGVCGMPNQRAAQYLKVDTGDCLSAGINIAFRCPPPSLSSRQSIGDLSRVEAEMQDVTRESLELQAK